MLKDGFVYLFDIDNTILQDIKYATKDNFTGQIVDGYVKPVGIVKQEVALKLKKIQKELLKENLSIKIFDLYRPKRACMFFKKWSHLPDDLKIKKKYYPTIEKGNLYGNYIKELSIHSLGYAVDMTIVDAITEKELNMGTIFDYFGEEGHLDTNKISEEAHANRKLLIDMMKKNGFTTIPKEWWHFNYDIKLDKKIYYDFVVR